MARLGNPLHLSSIYVGRLYQRQSIITKHACLKLAKL